MLDEWYYKDYSKLSEYIEDNKEDKKYKIYSLITPSWRNKTILPSRIKGNRKLDIDISMDVIEKMMEDYKKKVVENYLRSDDNSCYEDRSPETVINAFAYSIDPNKKPEIPKEVLEKMINQSCHFIKERK